MPIRLDYFFHVGVLDVEQRDGAHLSESAVRDYSKSIEMLSSSHNAPQARFHERTVDILISSVAL
jgi:hypothetical protein